MSSKFSTFVSSFNQATKGKQFEVFVKWFLENDPVWKSEVDKVWMWDDYPDRWGKDCGIDLVFRDKNNETWAVQAKCYDREYPVTKTDVDSFLSESNRPLIQRRLLIATTDNLGPNARKVCAEQEKPVTLFLFSDFEDSAIDYPESISDLSRAKLKPKPQPRDHQIEAIEKVAKGFKDANKGQLIMACGTGKTFTTLWIKEKLKAELTLILLPSLSLLSQTLKEWAFGMNTSFKSLSVCSDETVTKGASEDQLLESVQDLSFPVTSDPSLIADFLKSSGNRVVFSTYQSSRLIADAQKKTNIPSFDLVIADEAHRCAGNVSSAFTTILNDDLIKTKLKLFTTATPRTYSSNLKKQAEDLDFEIAGMDDEKVFGKEFHRLSFGEAIDRKLLTDYQLVIIGVDEPMIAELIKHRELLKTDSDEIIDAKSLAAEIGLIKAIKDYGLKRVLSFHSRVKSAEDFSKELPKVLDLIDEPNKPKGKLATGFVSGAMPTSYRRQKLEQLKELSQGDYAVLSNARCLSEGVDVPALDGIAIIDPKASQIDIVQTVGRAIRLSDNKSVGTILLPVFIENGDDPESSIESTNFKPIWDVVKALRSHDELLAFELDSLRTEMGRQKKRSVQVGGLKKIVIDVPISVDMNFSNALKTYLVEQTSASWNFWFGMVKAYSELNSIKLMQQKYINTEGYKIGSWVSNCRALYAQNKLSKERIEKFESIQGWSWDILESKWIEGYECLLDYLMLNKKSSLPSGNLIHNNYKLGSWIGVQRKAFKNNLLSKERISLLEAVKGWSWDHLEVLWDQAYEELINYQKVNGNLNLKRGYKTDLGFNLESWISIQRRALIKKELSKDRIEKLEKINGWVWNVFDDKWNLGYEELLAHLHSKKILISDYKYKTENGYKLGSWVATQRKLYKAGTLDQLRIKKLELINGWKWSPNDFWLDSYSDLLAYVKKFKSAKVQRINLPKGDSSLVNWIGHQRTNYKNKKISSDKIEKLESLPDWSWDVSDDNFTEGIERLRKYSIAFKTPNVPNDFIEKDGFKLGIWVANQRVAFKRKKLSPSDIASFEKMQGWSWDRINDKWLIGYEELKKYTIQYKTTEVPARYISPSGFKLGPWVAGQRYNFKLKKLSTDRIKLLSKISGWTWK